MEDFSSFPSTASTSQEDHDSSSGSTSSRKLKVTLLSSEWRSTKGGVSTINRELAIQLAKHPSVEVSVYLPQCSEEDKQDAASYNAFLIRAEAMPGFDNPVDWLSCLPEGHAVDCVIGYGAVLGRQVQLIKRHYKCKWIQIVPTAPEEQGMYRSRAVLRAEKLHQDEVKLCEKADQVVAVGPKLADVFRRYLRSCRKDQDVLNLTPGIFSEFANVTQAAEERETFSVLMFGPDDNRDFKLNGYDIAARAIAELKDEPKPYKLLFVGAPRGEEEKVKDLLLQQGIDRLQLTVRCFCEGREKLARLFCEVDLAIMPSRTEGFGLATLEALSAGLPVLVSGNSGLGEALKNVLYGSNCVVESDDPNVWAKAIKAVRQKDRKMRLEEIKILRESYAFKYNWENECDKLVERMLDITPGGFHATVPEPFVSSKPGEASNLYGDIAKKHSILASKYTRRSDRRPFPAEKPRRKKEVLTSLWKVNSIPNACTFPQPLPSPPPAPPRRPHPPRPVTTSTRTRPVTTSTWGRRAGVGTTTTTTRTAPTPRRRPTVAAKQPRRRPRPPSPHSSPSPPPSDDEGDDDRRRGLLRRLDLLNEDAHWYVQVPPLEIFVQALSQEIITLKVDSSDTIGNLKEKIKDKKGFPAEEQHLFFQRKKLKDDRTVGDYNIQNKSTLNLLLKEKIHAKTKVSPYQQVLEFNDKQLDDVHSLNYYGIENKSSVSVEILVRMTTGRDVMLSLFKSNTIKDVKERIQLREDISCYMQRVYFRYKLLRDNYTLSYYNIENGCFLDCDVLLIRIDVKMPNKDVISVNISPKDSVRSLMQIIQARGVNPPNQLSLVYNGEKLNNRFTLNHYKLRNGSLLNADFISGGDLDLRIDGEAQRSREASSNQPSTQEVFNRIADKYFENVDPSNPDERNGFLTYLEKVRKVLVLDIKKGSLIFTLECGSVQILDDLWEDYCTGHLNEVAQSYLMTDDILEEFGLSSLKLTSNIKEEDYKACRQRLVTNEADQMLDRFRTELQDAFRHWLPIRRKTKEKLKELARNLPSLLKKPGIVTAFTAATTTLGVLAAPFTLGASLAMAAAGAGVGAAIGVGASYLSAEVEEILKLAMVQVAIDMDRSAYAELQGRLDSLKSTFTSSMVGAAVSDVLTRASRFADSSVLPTDITQFVKSSLNRNGGLTSPIVQEIIGILNNLNCPDETDPWVESVIADAKYAEM